MSALSSNYEDGSLCSYTWVARNSAACLDERVLIDRGVGQHYMEAVRFLEVHACWNLVETGQFRLCFMCKATSDW